MRFLLPTIVCLLLTGCVTDSGTYVPGAPDKPVNQKYKKDAYECKRDASQSNGTWHSHFLNAMEAQNLYDECMDAKGYIKAPNGQ